MLADETKDLIVLMDQMNPIVINRKDTIRKQNVQSLLLKGKVSLIDSEMIKSKFCVYLIAVKH